MWNIIGDYLGQDVKDEFVRNPPKYVVSDDLSWLDEIILETRDQFVSMKQITAERMASHYRAFRASHGTRTANVDSFYCQGLRKLRSDEFDRLARELLLTQEFSYASEKSLVAAIEEIDAKGPGCREGYLYFCADEQELIENAGHYLIYGSEYLYCLAIRVVGAWHAQKLLTSIGKPTMIVCDLPYGYLSPDQQSEFAGMCLEVMFSELLGRNDNFGHGTAVMLSRDVPPKYIVGHYHPQETRDPFKW